MGLIALSLPLVVSVLAEKPLTSISASYHSEARDMFVGLLFVVGSFLFAYNGHALLESAASKLASIAAVCVAYFCFIPFRKDIRNLGGRRARRSAIYLVCGWIMILCMLAMLMATKMLSEDDEIYSPFRR